FLFTVCRDVNPHTYMLSTPEINHEWIKSASSIGICGATSTPRWLMEQVKNKVYKMTLK
ncbi:MAG: 4-hydroxy-3-methylbut-2-enyl diphosphate reductase, partial [Muribaculaceae bacterium]|nr:4-hydroxy-3-methylbut-2-enyl diphosphate reductase [Muribaculaceae bacterium]